MSSHAKTKYRRVRCRGCGSQEVEDSSDSRWWLPGVIVVEFKRRLSRDQIRALTDPISQTDVSWIDVEKLRQIVDHLLVKPPKWTFAFHPEDGPTAPDYERFVTFYLQPDVNVPEFAREISSLGGVVRASAEPRLSSPKQRIAMSEPPEHNFSATLSEAPLLNEPLAVPGGEPFGISAFVGEEELLNQWYLFRSKADQVLTNGINGAGVVVADIDWGFNVNHQEFVDKIKFTYNADTKENDVAYGPKKWHGTGTLGLIGAGDNNAGMLGFAAGAELWAIKAQDSVSLDNESWGHAIDTVRLRPSYGMPKVILIEASTNLGFNVEYSTQVRVPIMQAIADGCVVCVTAGNAGEDAGFIQGTIPIPESGSILVGATQYTPDPNTILRNSNFGSRIVVSAPGANETDVTCCDCANDSYRNNFGGSSGAAAKVAGAMALLLQTYQTLTHDQIVRAFAKMPLITTLSGRSMGRSLDIPQLITKAGEVLVEDQ